MSHEAVPGEEAEGGEAVKTSKPPKVVWIIWCDMAGHEVCTSRKHAEEWAALDRRNGDDSTVHRYTIAPKKKGRKP